MTESDNGFFGRFGGRYVAEILRRPIEELEEAFNTCMKDPSFLKELEEIRADFIGRPTPLYHAKRLSEQLGGAQIFVKLEGLANTGAHKINNAIGQALVAKRMGKTRIIAETGAGQHGVATAAACAKLGLKCRIYMGEVDVRRQQPNVATMEMYGAEVVAVTSGSRILKDAINDAMRDWATNFKDTHYLIGSALGPSPFPDMVRTFQSVIGREVQQQMAEKGRKIDAMVACVGGGSNAAYLNQLTANATGKTVYAGPGEATALGNIVAQMLTAGEYDSLAAARKAIFDSFAVKNTVFVGVDINPESLV